jgi:hypothetical protein
MYGSYVFLINQRDNVGRKLWNYFFQTAGTVPLLDLIIDSFSASLETVAVTVLCLYVAMFIILSLLYTVAFFKVVTLLVKHSMIRRNFS